MLTTASDSVISNWTTYYKNQSVLGRLGIAKKHYPAVASAIDQHWGDKKPHTKGVVWPIVPLCPQAGGSEHLQFSNELIKKCEAGKDDCMKNGKPKKGTTECIYLISLSFWMILLSSSFQRFVFSICNPKKRPFHLFLLGNGRYLNYKI